MDDEVGLVRVKGRTVEIYPVGVENILMGTVTAAPKVIQ